MDNNLEVDPIDLRMSSDHMDMHHAELQTAHTAANEAIEAAQAGWIGDSAAALHAKFAEWQAVTTQLANELADHSAAFISAADGYESVDANSAEQLDGQL